MFGYFLYIVILLSVQPGGCIVCMYHQRLTVGVSINYHFVRIVKVNDLQHYSQQFSFTTVAS
jgi:hypothetical protein